jgi:hypothetical protein
MVWRVAKRICGSKGEKHARRGRRRKGRASEL